MLPLDIEFHRGATFLPRLGLWLDAHEPQTGPERVFISHAHSDHIAPHREVVLSAVTARLLQDRLAGERQEHVLPFRESHEFTAPAGAFGLTLLPAGHIFGSAMCHLETASGTLLYTGDFKLRRGLSAEVCEPRKADYLIMETTFGRPEYRFPPADAVVRGIVRFCREALDNDETPVLLGYSLGKSQEILCGLGEAGLPIMLHGSVHRLTAIYEKFGQCFPPYERYDAARARGKVLLCPPSVSGSAMLRNLGRTRTAVLTGWAMDPNCKYRYRADAAFPLSDHADFPELLQLVREVSPKRVYTLHGFAADFARTLRQMGVDAVALSEPEQMGLDLHCPPPAPARQLDSPARIDAQHGETAVIGELFARFAETCAAVSCTSSKLEKTRLLANYLRELEPASLRPVTVWFTGLPFAASEHKVLQLGWAMLRDALCALADVSEEMFHQVYLTHSDLGETAFELASRAPAPPATLTVAEVDHFFAELHAAQGSIAKRTRLTAGLHRATPIELKYLVKIITSDLRIGLKEGLVEEAVAQAFDVRGDDVRKANLLLGHIGETAVLAKNQRLGSASLTPFRPVKFMLASPVENATEAWDRMHERGNADSLSLWLEDKYDGVRCQLHKVGDRIALYSRDLKDITRTFFEVAHAVARIKADLILDGEIVAMRQGRALPFSELQKRLGRRENDLFLGEEVPINFVVFDLLWRDGETCLDWPLSERRKTLETVADFPPLIRLATITQVDNPDAIEAAFAAARGRNNEGLMIKDPRSGYSPGRRGLDWLKLKKALATLDCVVIGAEYGHGKRKNVLSDYTFAVRDEHSGRLKTIGKAYTGLTDEEIQQLTTYFFSKALRQHGRYFEVPPEVVLEIAFDRLQPSNRHSSGLAMRFPRIIRIRTDKTAAEIDTLETARRLVKPPEE